MDKTNDNNIKIPKKYINIDNTFKKLCSIPQYAQRTSEWYEYRKDRITASDTSTALDLNPYETIENFIIKKCEGSTFFDNEAMFHGRKYEKIAISIYENLYNVNVTEFGSLPSDTYTFLGASPDGICNKTTLDNKGFSKKYGTMIEIKCPPIRPINIEGNVIGDICPFYYYCQIQQQLLCCNLNICDFWQCKIIEYLNEQEFLKDKVNTFITETILDKITNTNNEGIKYIKCNNNILKGAIIQFYPKNFIKHFDEDNIEWKSIFIYCPNINISSSEYKTYIDNTLKNLEIENKHIYDNYIFNKVIYWKLVKAHNVSIMKNNNFLYKIIPQLKYTWDEILYYRTNKDKIERIKKSNDCKMKKAKQNFNYKIYNNLITLHKIKILNKDISMCNIHNLYSYYNNNLTNVLL